MEHQHIVWQVFGHRYLEAGGSLPIPTKAVGHAPDIDWLQYRDSNICLKVIQGCLDRDLISDVCLHK